MRKFLSYLCVVLAAVSCKVSDMDDFDDTVDARIVGFCENLFDDEIAQYLNYFYNAFHISRFVEADAEVKMCGKYDLIRMELSYETDFYEYDLGKYAFSESGFFSEGGRNEIVSRYGIPIVMTMVSPDVWQMNVRGSKFEVRVVDEDDGGMRLSVSVSGRCVDESSYYAAYEIADMDVEYVHSKIMDFESITYVGSMTVRFYNEGALLKICKVEYAPLMPPHYDIVRP